MRGSDKLKSTEKRGFTATVFRIKGLSCRKFRVKFMSKFLPGTKGYCVAAVVAARNARPLKGAGFRMLRPGEMIYWAVVSRVVRGQRRNLKVLYVSKARKTHRLNKITALWNAKSKDRALRILAGGYRLERHLREAK